MASHPAITASPSRKNFAKLVPIVWESFQAVIKIIAKRQPDSSMTVTSVGLGQEKTTITGIGAMSECGKVYVTYNLACNSGRSGGLVTGQGRGSTADAIASGVFAGHW